MDLNKYSLSFFEDRYQHEKDLNVRDRLQMLMHLREGYTQRDVSSILHVSVGIVPYWKKRFEQEGIDGLKDKKGRGRKSLLKKKQLLSITKAIDEGIRMEDGYTRGYKTKDVNSLIREKYMVAYTLRHCRRLLRSLRYRLKVPRPRHKRRNQQAVGAFKRQLKKNEKYWAKE